MRALQLYEPLLAYMCKVNRLARNGVALSYGEVRGETLRLLSEIDSAAMNDAQLRDHVRALKAPINYFIDDVIAQSRLPFAKRWHEERLGYEKDGLAGDEAFFDYLDEALRKPPSATLAEQLLVYYVCIGLGFEGFYFNNPDRLRAYMRAMLPAVRQFLVEDTVQRMVPQPYGFTDTRDFARPPKLRRSLILAGLLALLAAGLPLYFRMGESLAEHSSAQLREILESHQGDRPAARGKSAPSDTRTE